ncbi:MAG: hypothetical protein HQL18_03230 [Candidatus Omnitrophica bacterium]|nr:hypothetical protein [Candidatus Omnitrophota bacterium]
MPKTIQTSLLILVVFLLIVAGIAGVAVVKNMGLEKEKQVLQGQVDSDQAKERDMLRDLKTREDQAKDLNRTIDQSSRDKDSLQRQLDDAKSDSRQISNDLESLKREKSDWEDRMRTLRRDNDSLLEKLKNRPVEEKIVEKIVEKVVPAPAAPVQAAPADSSSQPAAGPTTIVVENKANEEYWAGIMRQKASLELEISDLKKKMSEAALKVDELKKANSDLDIEVGRLKNEREEILRKIKYGEDLADNLSVELARARNEQKVIRDNADRVSSENQALRGEIKQLTSTRIVLEKSIAKLSDDKTTVEKKLIETENIVQGRIDEIWRIKKDVDNRFDVRKSEDGAVELAPIVVNANVEPVRSAPVAVVQQAPAPAPIVALAPAARNGAVVSVNDENNFVIISLGDKDGVRLGDAYKVYRDGKAIGAVSVIQVRKDICAADIKQKTVPFKPGDAVK